MRTLAFAAISLSILLAACGDRADHISNATPANYVETNTTWDDGQQK